MKNKYKQGEIVWAKTNPSLRLMVWSYVDEVYHCREVQATAKKEHAYTERELAGERDAVLPQGTNVTFG